MEKVMNYQFCEEERFYKDFVDLAAFIECGAHYNAENKQHVDWLKNRIHSVYLTGGNALCVYDQEKPAGFLLYQHDLGLKAVECFGKTARIVMLGFHDRYRGKGLGTELIERVCQIVKDHGAECIYTDTYLLNKQAINFYVNLNFIPIGVHEGKNGLDDAGQLYFYRKL